MLIYWFPTRVPVFPNAVEKIKYPRDTFLIKINRGQGGARGTGFALWRDSGLEGDLSLQDTPLSKQKPEDKNKTRKTSPFLKYSL